MEFVIKISRLYSVELSDGSRGVIGLSDAIVAESVTRPLGGRLNVTLSEWF